MYTGSVCVCGCAFLFLTLSLSLYLACYHSVQLTMELLNTLLTIFVQPRPNDGPNARSQSPVLVNWSLLEPNVNYYLNVNFYCCSIGTGSVVFSF